MSRRRESCLSSHPGRAQRRCGRERTTGRRSWGGLVLAIMVGVMLVARDDEPLQAVVHEPNESPDDSPDGQASVDSPAPAPQPADSPDDSPASPDSPGSPDSPS
jgi:hypothetical protein